jgi:hypothetical protein
MAAQRAATALRLTIDAYFDFRKARAKLYIAKYWQWRI